MSTSFKNKYDVFEFIAQSSIYGNLGLFIGAGFSMAVLNEESTVALNWPSLLELCCKSLDIDLDIKSLSGYSYPEIASYAAKTYAASHSCSYEDAVDKLKREISRRTSYYPEAEKRLEYAKYFQSLNPQWVITTNYDTIIESVLTGKCVSLSSEDYLVSKSDLVPVYHLHGVRTNPSSIVITQEDYVGLFRPNQYRQQKLPLTIKESVTILIGYNLGDFNVLTAVDWSNNVYSEQNTSHPQGIIQFLYKSSPKSKPYLSNNNITIVEFDDLPTLLVKLSSVIDTSRKAENEKVKEMEEWNNALISGDEEIVNKFIENKAFRLEIINFLQDDDFYTLSGFMELYTRSMDTTWERSRPSGGFYAYNENLKINLDILINIEVNKMPPVLFEAIVSNLYSLSYYIGHGTGRSWAAQDTLDMEKVKIPQETIDEVINLASLRRYRSIKDLFV